MVELCRKGDDQKTGTLVAYLSNGKKSRDLFSVPLNGQLALIPFHFVYSI